MSCATPPRPTPPEYRVIHARARQTIAFNEATVSADFSEAAIDANAVETIERSWGSMTREARWPDRKGKIARMKWHCAANLVAISDLLYSFCR